MEWGETAPTRPYQPRTVGQARTSCLPHRRQQNAEAPEQVRALFRQLTQPPRSNTDHDSLMVCPLDENQCSIHLAMRCRQEYSRLSTSSAHLQLEKSHE